MKDDRGTFQKPNGAPKGDAKIGPVLEKARKDRGLTLEEAEHATKIRKRYLDGLEREDFGVLPDAVYARGFLKTYANYLGLDGEELARELRDRRRPRRERSITYGAPRTSDFDRPLINPGELNGKEKRKISWTTVLNLLVALLLLAAVVGSLYYVGLGAQSAGQNPEENPQPQPPSQSQEDVANNPQPRGGAPAAGGEENGPPAQPQPAPQPDTLSVVVSVEGDPSWLSVLADGELVYEQIAQPGYSQTFEAQREVSIKTGNAGAVGVEVNGQDLGRLGESGEVLTRDFTLKTAT
jgi:cytoskeleton protein RodZ